MVFNPDIHEFDPRTGMIRHAETGHLVGLEEAPLAKPDHTDWPAWVEPHESHVHRHGGDGAPVHISAPGWECHVGRDGKVTVLCEDEEAAKRAQAPKDEKVVHHHDDGVDTVDPAALGVAGIAGAV